MKPILTAFFKEKILTVQYQDLSFTDYYLDSTTWRKMPSMKSVSLPQLEEIEKAMEIVSKKRIANEKRKQTRLLANKVYSKKKSEWLTEDVRQCIERLNTNTTQTKENSVSRVMGGWVQSLFRIK